MEFEFIVQGQPIPKARPRVCKNGHTFTPTKTKNYEEQIKIAFIEACRANDITPNFPLSCPIRVAMTCYFQKPKNPKNKTHHVTKPDADNLAKNLDALNKIAWVDDGQIVELLVRKRYSNIMIKNPCAYIFIESVE